MVRRAGHVLRAAGQELEHARLMRTKNTFVDIALPPEDDSGDEASSPSRGAPRARSWGAGAASAGAIASGHRPPSPPRDRRGAKSAAGLPGAAAPEGGLAEGWMTVVRNTFVEVRAVSAEEEVGQLRRSRSQGPLASSAPGGAAEDRAPSDRSFSAGDAAEGQTPAAGGVTGGTTASCAATPVKAGFHGARSLSPGSSSTCASGAASAGRSSAAERSPPLGPKAARQRLGPPSAAAECARLEQVRVRLDLEKILWGRMPGDCLQASAESSSDEDSSSGSDCEPTRQHLSAELLERIRRCRRERAARQAVA